MRCEWPRMTLEEAGVALLDCLHKTPPAASSGYPYIAIPQMKEGRLDFRSARRISRDDLEEWTRRARPAADDVVLSRRCNPGETAHVPPGVLFALGQNLVLLRSDGRRIYPPFLRWLTRGPEWRDEVRRFINVGAVFDSLKCRDVPRFELSIPPWAEQRAIAHILGTLDDKIELNRRMNETLEAMARAIFKSWFIDFDPVRANQEGRPSGLAEDLATLFPARLNAAPAGSVPDGWTVGQLGDVADNPRRTTKPGDIDPGSPYIALQHMPRGSIALADWSTAEGVASGKYRFKRNEVLFGKLRPYFHKVGVPALDGVCSTDILVIQPKSPEWYGFVLMHCSSTALVAHATSHSTGTKMPRTNWRDLGAFEVVLPTAPVAVAFTRMISPLIDRIRANIHESRTLASARDALLPKLLSGELRVPDAEKFLERVA